MRILLAGAAGFIGRHLASAFTAKGHEVVGCTRRRDEAFRRYPEIGWMKADFARDRSVSDWAPRLSGFDVVVNAVGILRERRGNGFEAVHCDAPYALYKACAESGVRKVIHVSAMGCDGNASSGYQLTKLRAERLLAELPLDWVVVRPSLVYGEDSPSSALFRLLARLPMIPLIADGAQRLQPLHVDDLSIAVARLLAAGSPSRAVLELAGPRPVTYREMLVALRAAMAVGPARFVHVPLRAVRFGAFLSDLIGVGPIGKDTLGMLLEGNVATKNAAPTLLGYAPREIGDFVRRARNAKGENNGHDKTYLPL
jgi:nucleoside-diphosphate-sugar epimerase